MLEAILSARREILLEMYWFGSDKTGQRFAEALREKAQQGVRVYVTYDAVGSWEANPAQFEAMRAAGCCVHVYNPLRAWPFRWRRSNRRDHRKLLVVDGQVGLTGGVNLADAWAPVAEGGRGFRDHVIRIEGPAVADMRAIFATTWPGTLPQITAPSRVGHTAVRVVANDFRKDRRRIEKAYLRAIRGARKRVLIENSYFVPSLFVRSALRRAAARGVEVRVVLPSISDVPLITFVTRRYYENLLEAGVGLYEWGESVLHSKIAVVDDWCTVGTHNLDYRSFLYNLEINVLIEDAVLAAELRERIERAIAASQHIDPETWRFRPLFQQWLERFLYRFRRLM
jgi:cardiolipin synthase